MSKLWGGGTKYIKRPSRKEAVYLQQLVHVMSKAYVSKDERVVVDRSNAVNHLAGCRSRAVGPVDAGEPGVARVALQQRQRTAARIAPFFRAERVLGRP
ncbi:hypothetical protein MTO96_009953 [Rhipicephalus appendiculatus]